MSGAGGSPGIDRPLFVLGTGRCGTTLLFRLLTHHPDLAWFSNYSERLPAVHAVALLQRVHDLPLSTRALARLGRLLPRATESYQMLGRLTGGLFTAPRRLRAEEATPGIQARFRRTVERYLRYSGRLRFANKHTGFARSQFLSAIFPDALFVHVYRDGRAVAHSMNRVDWWTGVDFWRWGEMRPEYREELERCGRERILAAAITWKTLMEEIKDELSELEPGRVLEIRYDELIADPCEAMARVLKFTDLRPTTRFFDRIAEERIDDRDVKWRGDLDAHAQSLLQSSLSAHLRKYGFEV